MVSFIRKLSLSKLEINSAVLLNVMQLTNLSLNSDGFSNADNSAVLEIINCETLEYNSSLDKPL
jgi:hypothetical protein